MLPVIYNKKPATKKAKAKNKIFTLYQCSYYPSERSDILMWYKGNTGSSPLN